MQWKLSQSVSRQESAYIPVYLQEIQIPTDKIHVGTQLQNKVSLSENKIKPKKHFNVVSLSSIF